MFIPPSSKGKGNIPWSKNQPIGVMIVPNPTLLTTASQVVSDANQPRVDSGQICPTDFARSSGKVCRAKRERVDRP